MHARTMVPIRLLCCVLLCHGRVFGLTRFNDQVSLTHGTNDVTQALSTGGDPNSCSTMPTVAPVRSPTHILAHPSPSPTAMTTTITDANLKEANHALVGTVMFVIFFYVLNKLAQVLWVVVLPQLWAVIRRVEATPPIRKISWEVWGPGPVTMNGWDFRLKLAILTFASGMCVSVTAMIWVERIRAILAGYRAFQNGHGTLGHVAWFFLIVLEQIGWVAGIQRALHDTWQAFHATGASHLNQKVLVVLGMLAIVAAFTKELVLPTLLEGF